ncbi:MAG: carboxypeptidase regulatory-like domain-containing protein, partial [bacterium]|nr:carboxypeptidase regulatory-like domain-containing protein [bacterium]
MSTGSNVGLLFVLLLAAVGARAQDRTSAITGVVFDESGAIVREAKVDALHVSTGENRTTRTNKEGFYRIALLELGAYMVTAEKAGFKGSRHEGVVLELDREAVVDHILYVGAQTESVVVSGQARIIDAAPSALTNLVDSNTIAKLPLNGRDYIQLATLQAGAPVAGGQ